MYVSCLPIIQCVEVRDTPFRKRQEIESRLNQNCGAPSCKILKNYLLDFFALIALLQVLIKLQKRKRKLFIRPFVIGVTSMLHQILKILQQVCL